MWNNLLKPLFALSVGLNLAFIAMWVFPLISTPGDGKNPSYSNKDGAVPSTLHREIGVTAEEWQKIAPLLEDFQEKANVQRRKINTLRGQLMDLLTAPEVDETAVRSKQEEILAGQRQMQNLVIDHLLKEKEFLSPEKGKKLMQFLCSQCRQASCAATGGGVSRIFEDHSGKTIPAQ